MDYVPVDRAKVKVWEKRKSWRNLFLEIRDAMGGSAPEAAGGESSTELHYRVDDTLGLGMC